MKQIGKQLKNIFNSWASTQAKAYSQKQWLLSKWEVLEGIEWSEDKINLMANNIVERLDLQQGDSLIDLGCGGGWIINALISRCRVIYGVDMSLAMLQYVQPPPGRVSLVCGEAACLPFESDCVNKLLSYFVLINIMDDSYVQKSVIEMMRVIKKGGRALLGQIPDKECARDYDWAKEQYLQYCQKEFRLGKSTRDDHSVPIHLFDRKQFIQFLNQNKIPFHIQDSFNPFYRPGESPTVPWRFDLVLEKP